MSSVSIHLQQAEHNEKSAIASQTDRPDWAVTMCFYAAIHYIQAYAVYHECDIETVYRNEYPNSHARRRAYVDDIESENDWLDLSFLYGKLELGSKKARYLQGINTTSKHYFKVSCGDYIKYLQTIKSILSIRELMRITLVKESSNIEAAGQ